MNLHVHAHEVRAGIFCPVADYFPLDVRFVSGLPSLEMNLLQSNNPSQSTTWAVNDILMLSENQKQSLKTRC